MAMELLEQEYWMLTAGSERQRQPSVGLEFGGLVKDELPRPMPLLLGGSCHMVGGCLEPNRCCCGCSC